MRWFNGEEVFIIGGERKKHTTAAAEVVTVTVTAVKKR